MELLKQLYMISSPSRKEKKMRKFIKGWIARNVPEAIVEIDPSGNVKVTKGISETYPCIVAHMDQVQDPHEHDFRVYSVEGKIFGFSPSAMEMRGLGADDKNGIWVALKCLKKYDVLKCAFFVGEEIGCLGSDAVDMNFFADCRWVVQCDRKGGSDLITMAGMEQLCSAEFLEATDCARFGYAKANGLMTDVMTLKERGLAVSCINMSCGYYAPHTEKEYTVVSELENCLHLVESMVERLTEVYPHEREDYYGYGKYGGSIYDYPSDYDGYGSPIAKSGYSLSDAEELVYEYLWNDPGISDDELVDVVSDWTDISAWRIREMVQEARADFNYYSEAKEAYAN